MLNKHLLYPAAVTQVLEQQQRVLTGLLDTRNYMPTAPQIRREPTNFCGSAHHPCAQNSLLLIHEMRLLITPKAVQVLEQQQRILTGLLDTCHTVSRDITMREAQLVKFDAEIRKYRQRGHVADRQVASYKELRQRSVAILPSLPNLIVPM